MNRLLLNKDYNRIIKPADLDQIIDGDFSLLLETEQVAQQEISSYISKRYDVSKIFTNTSAFDINTNYNAGDLVYVSAPYFDPSATYFPTDRDRKSVV